jgi:CRP-like cAMP-binding protein
MQQDTSLSLPSLDKLKTFELFSSLNNNTLQHILEECTFVVWKKSKTINPDIGIKYFHIILSGRLKLTQIDPKTGRSVALFLLEEGDIFDVFSLLDGEEHTVFPVALDNIELLCIPMSRAREWLDEHPEFNKKFLPYLGKQMRTLEQFSESLVFHDTSTRLASLILRHLGVKDNQHKIHPVKLINNLSHESLAEMIGSVRSVVTAQMNKLKEEEIILSKRGHLAIKDLEKLIKKCERLSVD